MQVQTMFLQCKENAGRILDCVGDIALQVYTCLALGADSLDTVELIMEFEKEFDIQIPDEDAEKISTVGDAIKYVEEHMA